MFPLNENRHGNSNWYSNKPPRARNGGDNPANRILARLPACKGRDSAGSTRRHHAHACDPHTIHCADRPSAAARSANFRNSRPIIRPSPCNAIPRCLLFRQVLAILYGCRGSDKQMRAFCRARGAGVRRSVANMQRLRRVMVSPSGRNYKKKRPPCACQRPKR